MNDMVSSKRHLSKEHISMIILAVLAALVLAGTLHTWFSFRIRAEQTSADYAAMSSQADEILAELEQMKEGLK